jgi:hypothetical protein
VQATTFEEADRNLRVGELVRDGEAAGAAADDAEITFDLGRDCALAGVDDHPPA